MTDITIPPEALEAAAKAIRDTFCNAMELQNEPEWENAAEGLKEGYREEARAACLAMLKAWPGTAVNDSCPVWHAYPHIILPLTENTDVEA